MLLQPFRELRDDLFVATAGEQHLPAIRELPQVSGSLAQFPCRPTAQPGGRDQPAVRQLTHGMPAPEQVRHAPVPEQLRDRRERSNRGLTVLG